MRYEEGDVRCRVKGVWFAVLEGSERRGGNTTQDDTGTKGAEQRDCCVCTGTVDRRLLPESFTVVVTVQAFGLFGENGNGSLSCSPGSGRVRVPWALKGPISLVDPHFKLSLKIQAQTQAQAGTRARWAERRGVRYGTVWYRYGT